MKQALRNYLHIRQHIDWGVQKIHSSGSSEYKGCEVKPALISKESYRNRQITFNIYSI